MTKKIVLLLVLALVLSGCTLAREDTPEETGAGFEDRLIGCVVTTEYLDLFDFEGYLQDNLSDVLGDGTIDGDTAAYQGRLYATPVEEAEDGEHFPYFEFENIDGYYYFAPTIRDGISTYQSSCTNGGISDIKNGIHVKDDAEELTLEGTMYVAKGQGEYSFYLNPVYQDAEGNVYLMAGTGLVTSSEGSGSQSIDSEVTVTIDGKATIQRSSVKINYEYVPLPERIVVLQLDAGSNVLSREEYRPGTLPEELAPAEGADYIVVETHSADSVSRELYGRDQEYLHTFVVMRDSVCESVSTKLLWETEE